MRKSVFDAEELRAASYVRHVEIHNTLPSTNDRARELAADARAELPALVVARQQTAGRGRGQHTWWSADGALTFSLLFESEKFEISTRSWPQLSLAIAVAVCDALAVEIEPPNRQVGEPSTSSVLRVAIKWPNDIVLDGGKVCGILIESPGGSAPAKDRLIVGVGININNSWQSAPHEAGPNGIALCDATSTRHDLQEILINTLNAIRKRIHQLATGDPQLPAAWQHLCWLTEQRVEAQANGNQWIDGICQGIAGDGALVIENVFGTHRIVSGSVRIA
jgi:BirA family biotin operon repressor/biotin-[acetyl-CoA-carboxylase] ligase